MSDVLARPASFAGLLGGARMVDRRGAVSSGMGVLSRSRYCVEPDVTAITVLADPGAAWLGPFIGAVNRAARLGPNWDSYGAVPLRPEAVIAALHLLDALRFDGPSPQLAPTSAGGVHLEWEEDDLAVEIDVTPDGGVTVLVDQGGDMEEWTTGPAGDGRLLSALRRVSGIRP